jgi:hypothetical protein
VALALHLTLLLALHLALLLLLPLVAGRAMPPVPLRQSQLLPQTGQPKLEGQCRPPAAASRVPMRATAAAACRPLMTAAPACCAPAGVQPPRRPHAAGRGKEKQTTMQQPPLMWCWQRLQREKRQTLRRRR